MNRPLLWVPPTRYCCAMPQRVRIALDAMGGDHGAAMVVPGAELSLTRHPAIEFLLFGDRLVGDPLLESRPQLQAAAHLAHTVLAGARDGQPRPPPVEEPHDRPD